MRKVSEMATNLDGIVVKNLDVAALESDGTISFEKVLGITKGASIEEEKEMVEIEFDGKQGEMKGTHIVKSIVPKLTCTLKSVNKDLNERYVNMTSIETSDGTYFKLETEISVVKLTEYHQNVSFITKRNDGKPIIYVLLNAFNMAGFSTAFEDGEDIEEEVEFTGTFALNDFRDLSSPSKSPLIIFVPSTKIKVVPTATINSVTPGETDVTLDIDAVDVDNSLSEQMKVNVYLAGNVVASKSIALGTGQIVLIEGLTASTDYDVKIEAKYDLLDGNGIVSEELATDVFTTLTP